MSYQQVKEEKESASDLNLCSDLTSRFQKLKEKQIEATMSFLQTSRETIKLWISLPEPGLNRIHIKIVKISSKNLAAQELIEMSYYRRSDQ